MWSILDINLHSKHHFSLHPGAEGADDVQDVHIISTDL
jgi:hypothetical protein